jgi:hypothetical protein
VHNINKSTPKLKAIHEQKNLAFIHNLRMLVKNSTEPQPDLTVDTHARNHNAQIPKPTSNLPLKILVLFHGTGSVEKQ